VDLKQLNSKYGPWFGFIARLLLGAVLFAAGWLKIFEPAKSQMAVRAYELLPISIANFMGIVLPWLEVAIGVTLILGIAVRFSAVVGGALMLMFIFAISQAALRGLSIDCGCFGGGGTVEPGKTKYLSEIIRDLGLGLLALYLIRYPLTKLALEKLDLTESSTMKNPKREDEKE
jgi:uncharacterized membrane protein YphA (DoxX/SURF4 family)